MTSASTSIESPFPGLRPFEVEDAPFFFGRERQVELLYAKLLSNRFVAVVGSSGSGKSSLVNAGLLSRLLEDHDLQGEFGWKLIRLRPLRNPLTQLAEAVARAKLSHDVNNDEFALVADRTFARLSRSTDGLVNLLDEMASGTNQRLLVVVDQFEELFRFSDTANSTQYDDRARFVNQLLNLVQTTDRPYHLVLTMRSEFIGECSAFEGLAETIGASQFLTPRLSRNERRVAIMGPLEKANGSIMPGLLQTLLNDVGNESDQLPVMQHALMQTWRTSGKDRNLTLDSYDDIGGMGRAISNHADGVFEQLRTVEKRIVAELLFKELTDVDRDGRIVRRPRTLVQIINSVGSKYKKSLRAVIDAFRADDCAFLLPSSAKPIEGDTIIDITHEAFIRKWSRLTKWVEQESADGRQYVRLEELVFENQDKPDFVLGIREATIRDKWWRAFKPTIGWAERYSNSQLNIAFDKVRKLIEDSVANSLREANRKKRSVYAIAALLLLVIGVSGFFIRDDIIQKKELAERGARATKALKRVYSLQVLQANNFIDTGDPVSAALILKNALPDESSRDRSVRERPFMPEVKNALVRALNSVREVAVLDGHTATLNGVEFSPDGKFVFTFGQDGQNLLWDRETEEVVWSASLQGGPYRGESNCKENSSSQNLQTLAAKFTPDGKQIIGIDCRNRGVVWSVDKVDGGQEKTELRSFPLIGANERESLSDSPRPVLDISSDGNWLIVGGLTNRASLWDLRTGLFARDFVGHETTVDSVRVVNVPNQISEKLVLTKAGTHCWMWNWRKYEPLISLVGTQRERASSTENEEKSLNLPYLFDDDCAALSVNESAGLIGLALDSSIRLVKISDILSQTDLLPEKAMKPDELQLYDKAYEVFEYSKPVVQMSLPNGVDSVVARLSDNSITLTTFGDWTPLFRVRGTSTSVSGFSFNPQKSEMAFAKEDGTVSIVSADKPLLNTPLGEEMKTSQLLAVASKLLKRCQSNEFQLRHLTEEEEEANCQYNWPLNSFVGRLKDTEHRLQNVRIEADAQAGANAAVETDIGLVNTLGGLAGNDERLRKLASQALVRVIISRLRAEPAMPAAHLVDATENLAPIESWDRIRNAILESLQGRLKALANDQANEAQMAQFRGQILFLAKMPEPQLKLLESTLADGILNWLEMDKVFDQLDRIGKLGPSIIQEVKKQYAGRLIDNAFGSLFDNAFEGREIDETTAAAEFELSKELYPRSEFKIGETFFELDTNSLEFTDVKLKSSRRFFELGLETTMRASDKFPEDQDLLFRTLSSQKEFYQEAGYDDRVNLLNARLEGIATQTDPPNKLVVAPSVKSASDYLEEGRNLWRSGEENGEIRALEKFEAGFALDPEDAQIRIWYAFALADHYSGYEFDLDKIELAKELYREGSAYDMETSREIWRIFAGESFGNSSLENGQSAREKFLSSTGPDFAEWIVWPLVAPQNEPDTFAPSASKLVRRFNLVRRLSKISRQRSKENLKFEWLNYQFIHSFYGLSDLYRSTKQLANSVVPPSRCDRISANGADPFRLSQNSVRFAQLGSTLGLERSIEICSAELGAVALDRSKKARLLFHIGRLEDAMSSKQKNVVEAERHGESAVKNYQSAMQLEYPYAFHNISNVYEDGSGVPKNANLARYYRHQYSNMVLRWTSGIAARSIMSTEMDLPNDEKLDAIKTILTWGAHVGDPEAHLFLAKLVENGTVSAQDEDFDTIGPAAFHYLVAKKLFLKRADRENVFYPEWQTPSDDRRAAAELEPRIQPALENLMLSETSESAFIGKVGGFFSLVSEASTFEEADPNALPPWYEPFVIDAPRFEFEK